MVSNELMPLKSIRKSGLCQTGLLFEDYAMLNK